jgi:hypothetical protein
MSGRIGDRVRTAADIRPELGEEGDEQPGGMSLRLRLDEANDPPGQP